MTTKDYTNGKIYKIEPNCEHDEGDVYVGCTTKKYLSQRMTSHKYKYNDWVKNPDTSKTSSFTLFEKYGIVNCNIILLESVKANSFDELKSREAYYIKSMKSFNSRSIL